MTNRISKLVLAAVLLSSVPLAARADGPGCDAAVQALVALVRNDFHR